MTKGTPSAGKRNSHTHTVCRRCNKRALHKQTKVCASCGYPSAKMRHYNWALKTHRRRGEGTGRMKYMKSIPRRAKNGFREGTTPAARTKHIKK
mmetsp:Transcript_18002/g.18000  ORF Transcript_18002/g.18000 Transcript_18002/m.18000 type:complete len:94 (+) Transcript_18002:23-304(+)